MTLAQVAASNAKAATQVRISAGNALIIPNLNSEHVFVTLVRSEISQKLVLMVIAPSVVTDAFHVKMLRAAWNVCLGMDTIL